MGVMGTDLGNESITKKVIAKIQEEEGYEILLVYGENEDFDYICRFMDVSPMIFSKEGVDRFLRELCQKPEGVPIYTCTISHDKKIMSREDAIKRIFETTTEWEMSPIAYEITEDNEKNSVTDIPEDSFIEAVMELFKELLDKKYIEAVVPCSYDLEKDEWMELSHSEACISQTEDFIKKLEIITNEQTMRIKQKLSLSVGKEEKSHCTNNDALIGFLHDALNEDRIGSVFPCVYDEYDGSWLETSFECEDDVCECDGIVLSIIDGTKCCGFIILKFSHNNIVDNKGENVLKSALEL